MNIETKGEMVKKWLDYQVDLYKAHNRHTMCVDDIQLVTMYNGYQGKKHTLDTGIHINGVDTIAKLLDLPVTVYEFDTESRWKYEHQIVWGGVVFYTLYEYEEVK